MARVFRIIGAALISFLAMAAPAFAQQTPQTVSVRASSQAGYVRVVFDWPAGPVGYTLAEEKGRGVIVTFNGAARFDAARAAPLSGSVLEGVEIRTADPPTVFLKTGALTRSRHFRAGNRVIVDLYGTAARKTADGSAPPAALPAPGTTEKSEKLEKPEKPEKPETIAPTAGGALARAPLSMPAAAPVTVASERLPRPALGPHVVSFTTTETVGMAAFERAGTLWLVFDRPDIQPSPRIAGPQENLFPPFERMALTGGTAFHMRLPGDVRLYAEGGGLVWRLVLTPVERDSTPVAAQRLKAEGGAGPALFWPMTHARRVLDLKDPAAGDTLRVATVGRAGDFSGPPQSFVELDTLDAPLGLVVASRVDDLSVSAQEGKGITATRPRGLTLSDNPDAQRSPPDPVPAHEPEPAPAAAPAPVASPLPEAPTEPQAARVTVDEGKKTENTPDEEDEHHEQEGGSKTPTSVMGPPSPPAKGASAMPGEGTVPAKERRIFDFRDWTMGGQTALRDNKRLIMAAIAAKDDTGKVEDLLSLAKMHVANGWGAEALGYLRIVTQILPELESNPRFIALRGAAQALAGKYESAIRDLLAPMLDEYNDVNFWRAYTLAQLEDWQQATARLPVRFEMLETYPPFLRNDMALALAEIVLRDGKSDVAESLLAYLDRDPQALRPGQKAARDYFRAEILRQRGEKEKAAAAFSALAMGSDEQFRARAGLAVTNLLLESGKIDVKEALDRLERLRFSWRGDEFEPLVNYRIGALYLKEGQYAKGLSILRDTVEEAPGNGLSETITAEMMRAYRDVFLTDTLDTLSPLDAITLYEEFRELVPPGAEGDRMAERLAERLAGADLYSRAADLLQYQLDHSLTGAEAARTAVRLAAIRLLDGRPEAAIAIVDRTAAALDGLDDATRREKIREMALLRARALSKMDKPDQALAILNAMPPDEAVNRLRVDIAWSSGNWDEAGQAMQDIILDQDIPPRGPLKPDQAILLLNRAVALNLADNRVGLANMRERFGSAMNATDKGKLFDVVTRPRQNSVLADRQTLTGVVSEVDMFKSFLETMREK